MKPSLTLILLVAWLLAGMPAYSQDAPEETVSPPKQQSRIFCARDKLRRGLANTTTGWLELPFTTFSEVVFGERSPFERLFVGLAVGGAKTVQRTAVGAFEMTTFFIPSYDPIMKPEYVSLSFKSVTAAEEPPPGDVREGLHVGGGPTIKP